MTTDAFWKWQESSGKKNDGYDLGLLREGWDAATRESLRDFRSIIAERDKYKAALIECLHIAQRGSRYNSLGQTVEDIATEALKS